MGVKEPCLINLIKNVYSFATSEEYDSEKKELALNKILELVSLIPKLSTVKADFMGSF